MFTTGKVGASDTCLIAVTAGAGRELEASVQLRRGRLPELARERDDHFQVRAERRV